MLTASGAVFQDWSSAYRLFSAARVSTDELFDGVRRHACGDQDTLIAALDDSLVPRSSLKLPGSAWRRDPKGPPFQVNLIRAQRFLQISMQPAPSSCLRTLVPIDFHPAPGLGPAPRRASPEELQDWNRRRRQQALPAVALERLKQLRKRLDEDQRRQLLLVAVDGGYTNRVLFASRLDRIDLVGRVRKDAKLFYPAPPAKAVGRPRSYGAQAPTPEQLRTDASTPWSTVTVSHRGEPWTLRYKRLTHLLWAKAGAARQLQMIVLAPTPYHKRKGAKADYRQPAFLLCTDADMPADRVIAAYLQRWGIEVNFRDEKSLLGIGDAQVRNPKSVPSVPAFAVACYSLLLLATGRAFPEAGVSGWPQPKWRTQRPRAFSLSQALCQLRGEAWGRALGVDNFPHFAKTPPADTKWQETLSQPAAAAIYAIR